MTSYSPPRMIFVSSRTIYSSRNSGLVGRSRKVQYSLTRVLKKKKTVYVASGIEPATINLFLRLIASYKVQNFGIKSIRQQSIRHTNLANVSGKYRDQKFPRNIHISCPTGSRMKLLLTSLFATQGRILYQASKEKWFTRLGQSRRSVNLSSVSTVPYSRKNLVAHFNFLLTCRHQCTVV